MSAVLTLNTGNDGREYDAFLREKVRFDRAYGFSVADSVVYLRRHDMDANTPTLFDLLDLEGTAA